VPTSRRDRNDELEQHREGRRWNTPPVDGVVCRFGYMLMADPGAALMETQRVLREGGALI